MDTPLISHNELAAIQQRVLANKTRQVAATTFAVGQHASHFRGQGVELEDNRPYHNGDDVRHMNWRATARHGRPVMKVFREERQRSLYLFVDKTQTMAFGTRNTLKANVAATSAAILAFSALNQHESVAGAVIDKQEHHFAATRSIDQTFDLIHRIAAPLHTCTPLWQRPQSNTLLSKLEQHTRQGSTIVLISDFIGLSDQHKTRLSQLAEKRRLLALHISDPAEESIADIGKIRLYSPLTQQHHFLDTSDDTQRQQLNAQLQRQRHELRNFFVRCNTPFQHLSTQHNVFDQLEYVL